MNLKTRYLGLDLPHPLIVGASPFAHNVDAVRQLADAGAAAIVMYSLFEEQLVAEQVASASATDDNNESYAEAITYLPESLASESTSEDYFDRIRQIKAAVRIPVIGSLNGSTAGGWTRYAKLMQEAGVSAIELNTYNLATDPTLSGAAIEDQLVTLVRNVRQGVSVPLAVKLSPFYSSLPHLAKRLTDAGADGLVLFNRFYQPDIDVENLEVVRLNLSDSSELLLRLHFLAILFGTVKADLAVTGGVHTSLDIVKSVMCGASAVQVVSALLQNGPAVIPALLASLTRWLEEHEYESLEQMRGSMSLMRCPNPGEYVRTNYMMMLDSWRTAEWGPQVLAPRVTGSGG